jgi:apolipoprotein N-acyltransferase
MTAMFAPMPPFGGRPGPVRRVAAGFAALTGWRRRLALFALGVLAVASMPPFHLLPVLAISLPGLVWMWDARAGRWGGFWTGWWWGWGFYSVGFYWISEALLVDPWRFGWMIPFATLGLGGLIAVFAGLATGLAGLIRLRGAGRVLLLAAAWGLGEWLRTFVLTGFPWNPLGSAWDPVLPVLQLGAVTSIHGLSLLTMLVFGLLAELGDDSPRRHRIAAGIAAIGLPAAIFLWGSARLAAHPTTYQPGVTLRLVQPDTKVSDKWVMKTRLHDLATAIALSRQPGLSRVSAVIWPETAAPFFLNVDSVHRMEAAQAAPPGGTLITGAPTITPPGTQPFHLWNSMLAIDSQGRILADYDKVHLVPFGEYVPLRGILPIDKITHGSIDFTPGPGLRTLHVAGLPAVAPLICYEAIFPGQVVAPGPRPRWLLNITDDGWFGASAGPYQHLAAARMRAIEEGLPLVRDAVTGISAVFDGLGRPIARLGLGERGILDVRLPEPTRSATPYGRWGNAIPLSLMAVFALAGLVLGRLPARPE